MHRNIRLSISEVNDQLVCRICAGYLIDATTIVECLHSFCRSCLVRYLALDGSCPLCGQIVHQTRPLENIRADKLLQDLVYKLVPGLFKREMLRRREFYADQIESAVLPAVGSSAGSLNELEDRGEIYIEPWLTRPGSGGQDTDDNISVRLQNGRHILKLSAFDVDKKTFSEGKEEEDTRYLLCPACLTIGHLYKFIRFKFDLNENFQTAIFHSDEILPEHYTLLDVAALYGWRRLEPLALYYVIHDVDTAAFHQSPARRPISAHRKLFYRQRTPSGNNSASSDSDADVCNNRSERWTIVPNPAIDNVLSADTEIESDATIDAYESSPLKALGLVPVRTLKKQFRRQKSGDNLSLKRSRRNSLQKLSSRHMHHRRRDLGRTFKDQFFNIPSRRDKSPNPRVNDINSSINDNQFSLKTSERTTVVSVLSDERVPSEELFHNTETETVIKTSGANHSIQRILTDVSDTSRVSTPRELSPAPPLPLKFEHFKKRMICSSIGGKSTNHTIANIIGLPRQRLSSATASQSFTIYEDPPSTNSDNTGNKTLPVGPSTPGRAKIGIVISHGRALLLQDRQRTTPGGDNMKQLNCSSLSSNLNLFQTGLPTIPPPDCIASQLAVDSNRHCDEQRPHGAVGLSSGKRGQNDSETENDVKIFSGLKRCRLNSSVSGLKEIGKSFWPGERRTPKVLHVNNGTSE